MFCFHCGKQISNDALFCQHCGTAQKAGVNDVSSTHDQSGDALDRDALILYLSNILSLEYAKKNYERQIWNIQDSINEITRGNYYKSYSVSQYCNVHFLYDGNYFGVLYNGTVPYYRSNINEGTQWIAIKNDNDARELMGAKQWNCVVDSNAGLLSRYLQKEEASDKALEAFAKFKAEAPTIFQSNTRIINDYLREQHNIQEELNEVLSLLKQAYEINIIPDSFRNEIHAIYYLHNFIASSQQSFTTALLHCDLEQIKTKLDRIIAQQENSILQQARMLSQNEEIVRQQQQQLEHLSNIATDARQAVQYTKIATAHLDTCAWISKANYIESHR